MELLCRIFFVGIYDKECHLTQKKKIKLFIYRRVFQFVINYAGDKNFL